MKPVAIIGAYAERRPAFHERRLEEVVFDAVAAALADAGVSRADLDNVVLAASDELDGRSISSMLTSAPAGGVLKDEIRTTGSGLYALFLGAMRIQTGLFDLGVAVSWSKASEASVPAVEWTALDPFTERPIGLIDPIATAVMANAYLAHFQRDPRDLDVRAATKRTRSGERPSHTYIAYPLRQEHLAPLVDGVAAVVLASPRWCASHRLHHDLAWLRGIGWATDSYALAERSLWTWPALQRAATAALHRAGCHIEQIDRYQVDDSSVLHEAMAVEAIGLTEPGTGFDYLAAQPPAPTPGASAQPVNISDGWQAGYPLVCAGLCRVAASFQQLVADQRAQWTLIHEAHGIAAQAHTVAILGRS